MKREKHFWKKLFCFVFLFTVVTGCGSVYAAEHGTVEEKETEDRSGMLEDELEHRSVIRRDRTGRKSSVS